MSTLETAIQIAAEAHRGQIDKSGEPYILHPLRVMLAQNGEVARIVGVLHDVIEDCEYDLTDIEFFGFAPEVTYAIDSVTRREGEDYFDYVKRANANLIGRRVKIADLNDNMDPRRMVVGDSGAQARMQKYLRALAMLTTEAA